MSNANRKPAAKITMYPVTAAIWRNENGKGEAFYNVTFERAFRNDTDQWQHSGNFSTGDLLLLAKVADRAHSVIFDLRAKDRQEQQIDE